MPKNPPMPPDTGSEEDLDDLVIDLSNTEEATFEPLPPGLYDVVIEEADSVISSTGKPMLKIVFTVLEEQFANRKLFHNWMLTEQGKPFLKRYLSNLGYDTSQGLKVNDLLADLPGMRARVKVRQKVYEGEKVNNITDVLAPKDGASGGSDGDLPV